MGLHINSYMKNALLDVAVQILVSLSPCPVTQQHLAEVSVYAVLCTSFHVKFNNIQ